MAEAIGKKAQNYAVGLEAPGEVPTGSPYPTYDPKAMMRQYGQAMNPLEMQANALGNNQLGLGGYGGQVNSATSFAPAQQSYQQSVLAGQYPAQFGQWTAERGLEVQREQMARDAQTQYLQNLLGVYGPTEQAKNAQASIIKQKRAAEKKRKQANAQARVGPLKTWLGPYGMLGEFLIS
jgi:hypothetical protein